jgi:fatty acid desaturase
MDRDFKARLHAMHHVGWSGTWLWLALIAAFFAVQGLLVGLMLAGPEYGWQVAVIVVCVLLSAYIMHSNLIAIHEAAHGLLCPLPWINDGIGRLLGLFGFLSFELYRTAHHTHHAYLATERDEELWPFVKPGTPLWIRRMAAFLELFCGLIWTPCLFLRAYFRKGTVICNPAIRRRIAFELGALVAVWTVILTTLASYNLLTIWVVCFLTPAWLAGCLQSLRKYIEHMGVTGSTALSATRSVHPVGWIGHVLSLTLFNEPFHGIHHKYPRLPQEVLPAFASILTPIHEGEIAPFSSYRSALWCMLGSLRDPRVGPAQHAAKLQELNTAQVCSVPTHAPTSVSCRR